MNLAYLDYLKSEHWAQLREEAKTRWGDRCCNCSVPKVDIHHLRYGNLYDVTTEDLMPLCRRCHDAVHASPKLKTLLTCEKPSHLKRELLIGFLAAKDEAVTIPVAKTTRGQIERERAKIIKALKKEKKEERKERTREFEWQVRNSQCERPDTRAGVVVLTRKLIEQCRTPRNGFSGETIRALGVSWPLPSKWTRKIKGKVITAEAYERAFRGRLIAGR